MFIPIPEQFVSIDEVVNLPRIQGFRELGRIKESCHYQLCQIIPGKITLVQVGALSYCFPILTCVSNINQQSND